MIRLTRTRFTATMTRPNVLGWLAAFAVSAAIWALIIGVLL